MPNLRTHAKDVAIGSITQSNLELVASILEAHAKRLRHPFFKWFHSDRKHAVNIAMVAAAFSRVKGIPEPLPTQFSSQVEIAFDGRNKNV